MRMTDAEKAEFLVEGAEVAVVNTSGGWGARLVATSTIAKVLKTQVVLANGRRFRVSDLEEHGGSRSYADRIVPADAPIVAYIHREDRLREAERGARAAVEHWLKSRRDSARVAEIVTQMTAYQSVLTETEATEAAESEED